MKHLTAPTRRKRAAAAAELSSRQTDVISLDLYFSAADARASHYSESFVECSFVVDAVIAASAAAQLVCLL